MKSASLRLRLMIYFILVFATLGLASATLSWFETKDKIDEFFDTYQIALARQLASVDWADIAEDSQSRTDRIIDKLHNAEDEDEALGFAVFSRDGHKIFHDNENGKDFYYGGYIGGFITQTVDDEQWRVVWIFSADEKYIIAVGQELAYRNDVIWDTLEEFITPWLGGILLALVVMLWLISKGFRPLQKLAADVSQRPASDLSPLSADGQPSEVTPLISSFNRYLEQIDSMIRRERGFIANASHELRTPLAGLKIQLDVARLEGLPEAERQSALDNLEQGINRASHLVEQLLTLSRLETSIFQNRLSVEPVDWSSIANTLFYEYQGRILQKHIKLQSSIAPQGAIANGDPTLCALLLRNLLDNALKYSPDGAELNLIITPEQISFSNSGVTLNADDLAHLSERFYRPAGQTEQGSGLGLSIVRCIADYYGCRLHIDCANQIFKVSITQS